MRASPERRDDGAGDRKGRGNAWITDYHSDPARADAVAQIRVEMAEDDRTDTPDTEAVVRETRGPHPR